MSEILFTILFILVGIMCIGAGFNFDNQYRKEYKGNNKAEYVKFNKIGLILIGGIMLFGVFLGLWLPVLKVTITFISSVFVVVLSIIYLMISRKKFSSKNN